MSNYEWRANLCCIATYKILENDNQLDQFEEQDIPFEQAKDIKLRDLRYYPKTTNNPDIIEVLSFEIARKFLKRIVKGYSVTKETSQISSADLLGGLASVFSDRNATIKDLAEKADSLIKFADEA